MKLSDQINRLHKAMADYGDTHCAIVLWLPSDVHWRAGETGDTLTDEQVAEVLEDLQNDHDAAIGICWDVIDEKIERVIECTPTPEDLKADHDYDMEHGK